MARPARPALTGRTTDTRMAVANTTMLLMKSILTASHRFMTCNAHGQVWIHLCVSLLSCPAMQHAEQTEHACSKAWSDSMRQLTVDAAKHSKHVCQRKLKAPAPAQHSTKKHSTACTAALQIYSIAVKQQRLSNLHRPPSPVALINQLLVLLSKLLLLLESPQCDQPRQRLAKLAEDGRQSNGVQPLQFPVGRDVHILYSEVTEEQQGGCNYKDSRGDKKDHS